MPSMPGLRKPSQENCFKFEASLHEFQASLHYKVILFLKNKQTNKTKQTSTKAKREEPDVMMRALPSTESSSLCDCGEVTECLVDESPFCYSKAKETCTLGL
jgi:hypothetical protein